MRRRSRVGGMAAAKRYRAASSRHSAVVGVSNHPHPHPFAIPAVDVDEPPGAESLGGP